MAAFTHPVPQTEDTFSWELEYGELLGMENLKACCAWPEGSGEAIDRGPDTKAYL